MRGVAWEGAAQLSRFIQQAPLDVPANVVLRGSDVVATADIPEGGELFADYGGGRYWGKRLARGERVTCPICLEDECYLRKLERCAHCRQYTHASCLRAHVERVRKARCECGLYVCTCDLLPRCSICRTPWPESLTGCELCRTPGCTLPIFHRSVCAVYSTAPALGRRRPQTRHRGCG